MTRWAAALDDHSSAQAAAAAAAARRARESYDRMIVHERHSNNHRDAYTGMHIFFPGHLGRHGSDRENANDYRATPTIDGDPLDQAWHTFIDQLTGALVSTAQTLTDSGTIDQTGGYSNDLDLEWSLTCTDPAARPALQFTSFATETYYDRVDVFDGTSAQHDLLLSASGSSIPNAVHGSGSSLFVQFQTDSSVTREGFRAEFSCSTAGFGPAGGCGASAAQLVDGGSIDLSGGYANNMECAWQLACSDTSMIAHLSFSAFDTETSFDRVTVYDGESASATQLARLSGSSLPTAIDGTGSSLFVSFHTDSSVTRDGFTAQATCVFAASPTVSSWLVSGAGAVHANGVYTPAALRTYSGAQTWAKGDLALFRWAHTHWVISDLGRNMDDFDESRWIYTAESSAETPPTHGWVTAATGADPPPTLGTTGESDPCDGVGVRLTDQTTLDHSGGYSNNEDCYWSLTCSDPTSRASLTFSSFTTESNFDWVTVTDVSHHGQQTLTHASGSSRPAPVSADGPELVVHFTTDSSITRDGFVADFDCRESEIPSGTVGCSPQHCSACIYSQYSCGLLWSDTCYCEWSESGCNEASWGDGSSSPNANQCAHGREVAGGLATQSAEHDPSKLAEFSLTNGVISNSDDSGLVQIRAQCPSTTVDAAMWTGVLDDDVSSSIHEMGVDTLFRLNRKGGTTETDTSTVDIWWTSARPAEFDHRAGITTIVGEWDGLSEVLSQPQPGPGPSRSGFAFSNTRYVEKDHTSIGKEVMVTSFLVSYYPAEMEVPGDGAGGTIATLRTSYTRAENGTFNLFRKVLSTQLDSMIEQAVPADAGEVHFSN